MLILHQRRKCAENILHDTQPYISVQAEFRFYLPAIFHSLDKIIFDILYYSVSVDPYTILKMKIKTSIVQVDGSHNSNLIITHKGFCVKETGLIFIIIYTEYRKIQEIGIEKKKNLII